MYFTTFVSFSRGVITNRAWALTDTAIMLGMDLVFGANTKNNPGSNRIYIIFWLWGTL